MPLLTVLIMMANHPTPIRSRTGLVVTTAGAPPEPDPDRSALNCWAWEVVHFYGLTETPWPLPVSEKQ
ncbi:MAG: hypothetical protein R2849_07180 [Thermomicrobiales bacterium]